MSTIQNLRKSLVRNWKPVCSVVGDADFGAQFAPFPSPLSPASSGAGLAPAKLAVCSSPLIFSLSFAIPQFKLESHKSSLQLPSGHSGPVLTLSNATRSSLFPPPHPTCWWWMKVSGVLFCWELLLGTSSVGFIHFSS